RSRTSITLPTGSTAQASARTIASRSAGAMRPACSSSICRRRRPASSIKPRNKRSHKNSKSGKGRNVMSDHAIDVHEELAEAKVSGFHVWLGLIMGLLTLFDGYDTFNPAYVIHYVVGPWGLKGGQAGLLISSGLVGFLVGAAVHGIIADRFGRRGTLLGGLWITSIFTLLTALLADSFVSFCVLRLLTGLGF